MKGRTGTGPEVLESGLQDFGPRTAVTACAGPRRTRPTSSGRRLGRRGRRRPCRHRCRSIPKDVTPATTFVLPIKFGPPESPKHVPPVLALFDSSIEPSPVYPVC